MNIVLDEKTIKELTTYLGEIPHKYAMPILVLLGEMQKEQAAPKSEPKLEPKSELKTKTK